MRGPRIASVAGSSVRPASTPVPATSMTARLIERTTSRSMNSVNSNMPANTVTPENAIERPAEAMVATTASWGSRPLSSSSSNRLTTISEKSMPSPRPIIDAVFNAKIEISLENDSRYMHGQRQRDACAAQQQGQGGGDNGAEDQQQQDADNR